MAHPIKKLLIENWQRKLVALLSASIIWLLVHNAITTTRTFTNVSVRVVNLPADKTIRGLMPNGILDRKIALTLTGTKKVIDAIEPGDFEVVLDAYGKSDHWIVEIAKKNLVSLNPDVDLIHNVTALSQNQFVIPLSTLITAKIPVYIMPPKGEPPEGYQFLGIFPKKLTHVVSGPEEDVKELQTKGLELIFDLGKISSEDLKQIGASENDEVSFTVPESWKKVSIPYYRNLQQDLNGPEAKNLRIDFLRKEQLPINQMIPVTVFYPVEYSATVNPDTHPLIESKELKKQNGIYLLTEPLFADNVSKLFLDIIKDRLEICVVSHPKNNNLNEPLSYFLDFVDPQNLEDTYAALFTSTGLKSDVARDRFRTYLKTIELKTAAGKRFELHAYLRGSGIRIESDVKTLAEDVVPE